MNVHEILSRTGRILLSAQMAICLSIALAISGSICVGQALADTAAPSVDVTRAATGKVVIKKGQTYKLGAKTSRGKLSYKSNKPKTVSISKKGVLKAKKVGKATITVKAKYGKLTTTKKIKVTVVKPSKYKKAKKLKAKISNSNLYVGQSAKVSTSFTPKKASNKNITFKSSNTKVAAVSTSGVVTAKKAGTAKITVTSCDNKKAKKTITITVKSKSNAIKVKSIDATLAKSTLNVGETTNIKVAFNPSNATNKNVTYTSSDTRIATVSEKGVVTAKKAGTAKITVTSVDSQSAKSTVNVVVIDASTDRDSITANTETTNLLVGDRASIDVTIKSPSIDNTKATLTSSDNHVLMVLESGELLACKAGNATVTITSIANPKLSTKITFTIQDHYYSVDSDGDGITDYMEETFVGTDPRHPDNLDELPNMVIYAEDAHVINNHQQRVLTAEVDENGTYDQSDDIIRITALLDGSIDEGEVLAVEECSDFPYGIAVKADAVTHNNDGSYTIVGHYPELVEFIRFYSYHKAVSDESSGITTQSAEGGVNFPLNYDPITLFNKDEANAYLSLKLNELSGGLDFNETVIGVVYETIVGCNGEAWNLQIGPGGGYNYVMDVPVECKIVDVYGNGRVSFTITGKGEDEARLGVPIPIEPVSGAGCGAYFQPIFHAAVEGGLTFDFDWNLNAFFYFGDVAQSDNASSFAGHPSISRTSKGATFSADTGVMLDFSVRLFDQRMASCGADIGVSGSLEAKQQIPSDVLCVSLDGGLYLDVYAELVPDVDLIELRAANRLIGSESNDFGLGLNVSLHWENGEYKQGGCTFELSDNVESVINSLNGWWQGGNGWEWYDEYLYIHDGKGYFFSSDGAFLQEGRTYEPADFVRFENGLADDKSGKYSGGPGYFIYGVNKSTYGSYLSDSDQNSLVTINMDGSGYTAKNGWGRVAEPDWADEAQELLALRRLNGWWQSFGQSGMSWWHFVDGSLYYYTRDYNAETYSYLGMAYEVSAMEFEAGDTSWLDHNFPNQNGYQVMIWTTSSSTRYGSWLLIDDDQNTLVAAGLDGSGYSGTDSRGRVESPPTALLNVANDAESSSSLMAGSI